MIRGIDLSSYQSSIDFSSLKQLQIEFVFTKLAEGMNTQPDPTFIRNIRGCVANHIIVGPYAYVHPLPEYDPQRQARLHYQLGGSLPTPSGELPLAIDLEWPEPKNWTSYGCSANQIRDWLRLYLAEANNLWGRCPILYSYPDFIRHLALPDWNFGLWIASYNTEEWPDTIPQTHQPILPKPFTAWEFWQWSGGLVHLPNGTPVDANVFNGSIEDLRAFVTQPPIPVTGIA